MKTYKIFKNDAQIPPLRFWFNWWGLRKLFSKLPNVQPGLRMIVLTPTEVFSDGFKLFRCCKLILELNDQLLFGLSVHATGRLMREGKVLPFSCDSFHRSRGQPCVKSEAHNGLWVTLLCPTLCDRRCGCCFLGFHLGFFICVIVCVAFIVRSILALDLWFSSFYSLQ